MKTLVLTGFLACILCLRAGAQVRGIIREASAGKDTSAIPGVTVFWLNSTVGATTNDKGYFSIAPVAGTDRLVISAIGYRPDTLLVKDSTVFLRITIHGGVELDAVDVVYETPNSEFSYMSPIKTETLNERSLMKAACCNLSESFETNPSIDVNFADAVSGARQIQMLGLSGQYAQITKENMPYLRGLAAGYGLTFIPGTWIKSIQLGKGAGSVVNGYESFTGQINTELQEPGHSDRLSFNAYGNQNGRNEYNLNLSQKIKEGFSVGLLTHASFNPLAQDMNGDGFADIPTGRQLNIMNKYQLNNKKGLELQFGGGYLKDTRDGGQFRELMHGSDSIPLYKIGIDNEKWELYSKTGYIFKNKPATSMGLQLSYLDHRQHNFYGHNVYSGSQATAYANFIYQGILKTTDHAYKVGASYMDDLWNENFNLSQFRRHEQVGGAFAEYAYSFKERFNLVAGLRGDYHNYYGLFFTPRLHLRYALNNSKTVFRASAGRALRTANIFADNLFLMASSRQWVLQPSDIGTPYGLKPETGWNYGLNFTQKLRLNYREAYVTIDLYRTDFTSQVVIDMDQNTQQVLIYNLNGPSFSNTAQAEFGWEVRKRLNVKTAYRYVDTEVKYKQGLMQKPYVSAHRAFVNLAYETKGRHWLFDATVQYNGRKRLPYTGSNPSEYQRAAYSPSFYNVLAQVTYVAKIKSSELNIYVGVENLLDYRQNNPIVSADAPYSKYFDASMVWGPIYGRMLYAGLRFKIK